MNPVYPQMVHLPESAVENTEESSNTYDKIVPLLGCSVLSVMTICMTFGYYRQRRMRYVCGSILLTAGSLTATAYFAINYFKIPININP
jgi:hypothetical protein